VVVLVYYSGKWIFCLCLTGLIVSWTLYSGHHFYLLARFICWFFLKKKNHVKICYLSCLFNNRLFYRFQLHWIWLRTAMERIESWEKELTLTTICILLLRSAMLLLRALLSTWFKGTVKNSKSIMQLLMLWVIFLVVFLCRSIQ